MTTCLVLAQDNPRFNSQLFLHDTPYILLFAYRDSMCSYNWLIHGIHAVTSTSRLFKCLLTMAKRLFYRAWNATLGKIGRRATEDVILQLIRSKCLSALLYGLEACPLRKADRNSLDFVVNRLFMKLFKTNNIDTVNYCRAEFQFELPCIVLEQRRRKFLG